MESARSRKSERGMQGVCTKPKASSSEEESSEEEEESSSSIYITGGQESSLDDEGDFEGDDK